MYNHYVFTPDGACSHSRIPDSCSGPEPQPQAASPAPAGSFLKNLLPKGFDSGDLLVMLLLLLMAGDREDSRNEALLTAALYFIL